VKGGEAGLNLAITINQVDIPIGAVREKTAKGQELAPTERNVVADQSRKCYDFRIHNLKN